MKQPKKIIFDTDIGGDCDDAGALALLHRLCDLGEAELLATTHCFATPYVAGCMDAINTYYGRQVPVGVNYAVTKSTDEGRYARALCEQCPNRYPTSSFGTPLAAPDSVDLIRSILADAEDKSITLVVTGDMGTMARLVLSQGDTISPMSGKELIARKIERTVVMGGRFFESWPMVIYADNKIGAKIVDWEWNIHGAIKDAQTVCQEWQGELIFSSYEIGSYILTMVGYNEKAPTDDPVRLAYELRVGNRGRCSWDHTAVLDAVRPNTYWNYHEFGKISVDDEGITHWKKDITGKHSYLLPKVDYDEVRRVIDELVLPSNS